MVYLKLFLQIVPFIISLVKAVEEFMADEPKTGEQKKATVMDAVKAIIDVWGEVVTGGAKDAWEKLSPLISKTIDFAVGIIFNFNK